MSDQMITMKQIAEMAGVHRSTVDKVIHNRPGVSDEQRRRILKIIEVSGYKPNQAGIALQNQSKVFLIDVILMQVDATLYIQQGISETEEALGNIKLQVRYHFIEGSTTEKMLSVLSSIRKEKDSDGIIIMPHNSPELLEYINEFSEEGTPVICVNSEADECSCLQYVGPNNITASSLAGQLMSTLLGNTGKVAIITSSVNTSNNNTSTEIRQKTFQKYLEMQSPDIEILPILENYESHEVTERLVIRLLEEHQDLKGIYCTTGGAYKIGEAVELTGRTGQITIITHELYPEILELMRRNVIFCTIGSELVEQGRIAMKTLMDYLLYRKEPSVKYYFTKSIIVIRENIYGSEP